MRNAKFMFRATIENVQLSKAKGYPQTPHPFQPSPFRGRPYVSPFRRDSERWGNISSLSTYPYPLPFRKGNNIVPPTGGIEGGERFREVLIANSYEQYYFIGHYINHQRQVTAQLLRAEPAPRSIKKVPE